MMHYFCALNTLQYKKKIALLEPLLGYMQAQVNTVLFLDYNCPKNFILSLIFILNIRVLQTKIKTLICVCVLKTN